MVARLTSRTLRARPETTTAPSMPTKSHTSETIVERTCSMSDIPPGSPQKLWAKVAGSNLDRSTTHTMKRASGTSLASVMTVFTPAATWTPRMSRKTSSHRNAEAQAMATRLLPAPKTGKKCPSAAKSMMP